MYLYERAVFVWCIRKHLRVAEVFSVAICRMATARGGRLASKLFHHY